MGYLVSTCLSCLPILKSSPVPTQVKNASSLSLFSVVWPLLLSLLRSYPILLSTSTFFFHQTGLLTLPQAHFQFQPFVETVLCGLKVNCPPCVWTQSPDGGFGRLSGGLADSRSLEMVFGGYQLLVLSCTIHTWSWCEAGITSAATLSLLWQIVGQKQVLFPWLFMSSLVIAVRKFLPQIPSIPRYWPGSPSN